MPAALRLTTPAGAMLTHVLAFPLVLELATGRRTNRFERDSLDLSAREVIAIGAGRAEWDAMLRFDRNAEPLIDILAHAADGSVITYYPDTAGPGVALWLVNVAEVVRLMQDAQRYGFGEYQIPVRFRDASASGASMQAISSPWLWRHRAGSRARSSTFTRSGAIGSYRDIDGLQKQAAANVLRTTWRTVNGVLRPLTLLEVPRTNKLIRSEALDNAAWAKSEVTIVPNNGMGPDGTLALDSIIESVNNAAHFLTQNVTGVTANGVFALSGFFIAAARSWIRLVLFETADGGNTFSAWFNLGTGVVGTRNDAGTGNTVASYIEDWTHVFPGLYRVVSVGQVGNGATALTAYYEITLSDGTTTYDGDGASGLFGGCMQLEQVSQEASTYIPTVAAEASRGAEAFSDGFPYTPRQLADMGGATFYVDYIEGLVPNWVTEASFNPGLVSVSNTGLTGHYFLLSRPSGGDVYEANYTGVASQVDLNPTRGNRIQLAGQFVPLSATTVGVRLLGRKNGATNADGGLQTVATPASSFGGQTIRLGGIDNAGRGIQEYADAIVFPGLLDIDQCERIAA